MFLKWLDKNTKFLEEISLAYIWCFGTREGLDAAFYRPFKLLVSYAIFMTTVCFISWMFSLIIL
jgi:hypothetical protein